MSRKFARCFLLCAGAAGLLACGEQGESPQTAPVEANQTVGAPAAPPVQPPMVVSSPAYRCDDGQALYVDVVNDDSFVNVRDSRQDIPIRLNRNSETGGFEGDGRSLSGRGDTVRYSAPERPEQDCRIASE